MGIGFTNQINYRKSPIKRPRLTKKLKNNKIKPKENSVWHVIIISIGNFRFIEKVKYVMPVIRETKKNSFCTSSERLFLKDGNFNNNWVGHKVIKPVHAKSFQRIICTK